MSEFRDEEGALHKGFNAVSAVDAYAAHIHSELVSLGKDPFEMLNQGVAGDRNDTHFRGVLAAANGNFRVIRDVAKANKHAFLTKGNPKKLASNGSGDTVSVSIGWGQGGYGVGGYGGASQLIVNCLDGSQKKLLRELDAALAYLDDVARELGLPV
ncbi:hypothetical protein [Leisingera daeponensis]|uniref:hypothetical protein n=1 Tax=Leisingera daeponensis TaxID=405746 RepID=UPI001C9893DA|nr:hypothetical protein [Leisingera daeponensis]MBY6056780.1 hypothetical protein [Leisingera daeponensis]